MPYRKRARVIVSKNVTDCNVKLSLQSPKKEDSLQEEALRVTGSKKRDSSGTVKTERHSSSPEKNVISLTESKKQNESAVETHASDNVTSKNSIKTSDYEKICKELKVILKPIKFDIKSKRSLIAPVALSKYELEFLKCTKSSHEDDEYMQNCVEIKEEPIDENSEETNQSTASTEWETAVSTQSEEPKKSRGGSAKKHSQSLLKKECIFGSVKTVDADNSSQQSVIVDRPITVGVNQPITDVDVPTSNGVKKLRHTFSLSSEASTNCTCECPTSNTINLSNMLSALSTRADSSDINSIPASISKTINLCDTLSTLSSKVSPGNISSESDSENISTVQPSISKGMKLHDAKFQMIEKILSLSDASQSSESQGTDLYTDLPFEDLKVLVGKLDTDKFLTSEQALQIWGKLETEAMSSKDLRVHPRNR